MASLEERLHSYEPLWGQWRVGKRIYAGERTCVFELERVRCDKELRCILKVMTIQDQPEEKLAELFARTIDEIESMELLSDSEYVVGLLNDDVKEIRAEGGALRGYDVLLRMEKLDCLSDLLRDGEEFSEETISALGADLCRALMLAHGRGVVHRDIKPANIFRSGDGRFKLGDFGASGSVRVSGYLETVTGTPAYMAPEVARGEAYGPGADLYSLGVVLYQLLNNNFLPLTEDGSTYSEREEAIRKRLRGALLPPAPRCGEALNRVLLTACAPEPELRFSSARDFYEALTACALNGTSGNYAAGNCIAGDCNVGNCAVGDCGAGAAESGLCGKNSSGRTAGRLRKAVPAAVLCVVFFLAGILLPIGSGMQALPGQSNGAIYSDSEGEEALLNNSRYEVVVQYMTWEDAKVYCEGRGGHLAVITSRAEEKKVLDLLDENGVTAAWIGASNRNSSKGFKWVTEERFAYAAWGLNEPNNAGGIEYYLMLVNSPTQGWVWNDSREDGLSMFPVNQVGFVCEWDGD